MTILGIETSCDETAAAIVQDGRKILSNIVASSVKLHQKSGGIIPEIAAREQARFIIPVIKESLIKANIKPRELSALAVTVGPGLIGSLLVGVETAKTLAYLWQKPLIPINHLQAHLYANWLRAEKKIPKFPVIGLVVSGGHTDLVLMKNHHEIKWLGGTRDDAAGECFDKCARLLNLGYPGGPAISRAAIKFPKEERRNKIKLPRPMIFEDNFDFSFSGLKTAVLNKVKKLKEDKHFNKTNINQVANEIQEAITDVLITKTKKAAEKYKVNSILLAGGVIANSRLREKFKLSTLNSLLFIPSPILCTDNATFVAANAFFNYHPIPWQKIQADSSLEIEEMIKS
jgi:N6-L-threonylcarbamoyladenine synthase